MSGRDELTPDQEAAGEPGGARQQRARWGEPDAPEVGSWLRIERDGTVTVYTGKAEVGQNIRTSLTQIVAEELRLHVEAIRLVMADTDLTPFDMGTFGSMTTPFMGPQLRKAAATAREMLVDSAAERWHVDRTSIGVKDGRVLNDRTGEVLSFQDLAGDFRPGEPVREHPPTTPPRDWTVAGARVPKIGGRAFVTGEHRYTTDMKLPGMVCGKQLKPPAFGARLSSLDATAAEAIPGVTTVRNGDLVGVTGPNRPAVGRAVAAIKAEWETPTGQLSNAQLFDHLKSHPAEPEGYHRYIPTKFEQGSLQRGFAAADRTLQNRYTAAYIAHCPLEPRAALAKWEDDRLTVWTGTQRPFGVRGELAQALNIPEDRIRVIVADTGSGYGGKHTGEVAIEAAWIARACGKPVSVAWSREEEFTWAYFRNAGLIEIRSGVRDDGTVTAWEYDNYNSGPEAMHTPYAVANQRIEFHFANSPLRQGSYRALAATANVFARETHMDELAHQVGMDPLGFRLKNTKDERLRAVLEAAVERFGWRRSKAGADRGFGIACGLEKGSYVATCAEVEVDRATGHVRIVRVVEAFDCGAVVNPDGLRNQIEGNIVQAIGGALFERIEFASGRILNPHFADYRLPRFDDLPAIETVVLDRRDVPPAGAGETPIVGLAPACGNAIFAATGMRLRSLPLLPDSSIKSGRPRETSRGPSALA
jgi:nicotinate dehydrogenase subunit B